MRMITIITVSVLVTALWSATLSIAAKVVTHGETVFIVDRTGEKWDVTQAKSLGFVPHKFQYGIGRNAFTPLQDKDFDNEDVGSLNNSRIIGIAGDGEAHAYSIDLLRYHEIANTTLEGQSIAVGY